MSRYTFAIILLLTVVLFSTSSAQILRKATCLLQPTEGNNATGSLTFEQTVSGYLVSGTVENLPGANKQYGFHVHEFGALYKKDGTGTGGHFTASSPTHNNDLDDMNRHTGDMGNITSDANMKATISLTKVLWTLNGTTSIVGRGVIVHAQPDDGGQPTGNAGSRIAQCVIGLVADANNMATNENSFNFATAELQAYDSSKKGTYYGRVNFKTSGNNVDVTAKICGLDTGMYGFHIHQYGDLLGNKNVGDHFNPQMNNHSNVITDEDRHVGDMGNIQFTNGTAQVSITLNKVSLSTMESIVGRAIIVHSGMDQGRAVQPTGGSGTKTITGVIGVVDKDVGLDDINCMVTPTPSKSPSPSPSKSPSPPSPPPSSASSLSGCLIFTLVSFALFFVSF